MQKPSERYKLTSDNNIITFKKPVHDPFNVNLMWRPLETTICLQSWSSV